MYGHFDAFRDRLKREEAKKALRRNGLYDRKESLIDNSALKDLNEFDFPDVTDAELKTIKEKIQRKAFKKRKKERIILSIFIVISLVFVLTNINISPNQIQKQKPNTLISEEDEFLDKNINEYIYLTGEGDKWVEKRNWDNAIYWYKKAVQLFPKEFDANYRLALTYSYSCKNENRNCKIGQELTNKLIKYFPEKENLRELKNNFNLINKIK